MATTSQVVTATPTALSGITQAVTYTLQNRGPASINVQIATAAPAADSVNCFVLSPIGTGRDWLAGKTGSGESIYVWLGSLASGDGRVAYETAV